MAYPARLFAVELRRELSSRNLKLAEAMVHESTFSAIPSVLYQEVHGEHGNFLPASYRRICASPDWRRRLKKCYTASRRVARSNDRTRQELDCAVSSDALLMNIFCYPGVTHRRALCSLLGTNPGVRPQFGVKPGIPLARGLADRTEIDMSLDHLFVEAKLTETGFQNARPGLVARYKDFDAVFDADALPIADGVFHSYQLIRGVLAAHHGQRTFLVLCDGRRTDLKEAWYRVVCAVRGCDLKSRLAILTWQELAAVLPTKLQKFLEEKYGIVSAPCAIRLNS